MRVLVLGAGGLIGNHVVRALARRGHSVRGLARGDASRVKVAAAGGLPVAGDLRGAATWIEHLVGVDAVIQAAATWEGDLAEVDRKVVGALEEHARPLRVLYTGGCWLYGDTAGVAVDESAPLRPLPAFSWMAEHWRRLLTAKHLASAMIHPAMVFADQSGGCLERFAREARERGRVRVFGRGLTRWPMVHASDLADLYAQAVEGARDGEVFNAASIPAVEVREIARAAARIHGGGSEPEPAPLETAVAEFGEWAAGYGLDQGMRADRARDRFGWSPSRLDWTACLE